MLFSTNLDILFLFTPVNAWAMTIQGGKTAIITKNQQNKGQTKHTLVNINIKNEKRKMMKYVIIMQLKLLM